MTRLLEKIIFACTAVGSIIGLAEAYTPPSEVLKTLDKLRGYSELTSAAGSMDIDTYTSNLTTWQMSHGGFSKARAAMYVNPYDGKAALSDWTGTAGTPLGMYDNSATVQEMRLLAVRYKATTNTTYKTRFKASFNKAVGFVLASQLTTGGWPQVHPKRGNYSDLATYNDNAMVRVMVLVRDIVDNKSPFDSDITATDSVARLKTALDKAVDFALKAQIINNGKPTLWCAQHDPVTFAPMGARAYELASKSGSESVPVAYFLMAWPNQSAAVQNAVKGAIAWYKKTRVSDLKFSNGLFVASPGASLWYRFYNVEDDRQFFCDRDGIKTYDFMSVSEERRTGYQWGGDYGSTLIGLEAGYLSALAATAVTLPEKRIGIVMRVGPGRITVRVPCDGRFVVTYLDARGALLDRQEAWSTEGILDARTPATLRNGVVVLRVSRPGEPPFVARQFVRW
ncbi:MAG: pectate lyase [Chitinispirillaceae bacterium]|nr:pectate lyase [Chitinispirillaceae bacterium]